MNEITVAEFLEENKDFLFPNKKWSDFEVEEMLVSLPDELEMTVKSIPFRKPSVVQIISFLVGSIGVDRFYLGDKKKGILKYFSFGGFGIWWIADIVSAKERCRTYNCEKLMEAVNDPSLVGSMIDVDNKLNDTVKKAKLYAPAIKEAAKGLGEVRKTFYK